MMKKILLPFLLFLCSGVFAQIEKDVPEAPNPMRFVVDKTATLTEDQLHTLEAKLKGYEDSTSTQFEVVIVSSTAPYEISEYAIALGRKWGIGQKGKNNGLVFLIAKDDRKMFIAPGYGLEGAIPDITAKTIIEKIVLPNFKGSDFYGGIDQGIDALVLAAKGEFVADAYSSSGSDGKGGFPLPIAIMLFILIFAIKTSSRRRTGGHWTFGSGGGSYGGASSWGSSSSDSGSSFGGGSFGGGGAGGSW